MGGSSNGCRRLLSEINVTPLVDVMLVLLIIFMVTAPMMTKGIAVNLPETTAKALPQKKKHIEVIVSEKGNIFMDGIPVDEKSLVTKLSQLKDKGAVSQVLLRADKKVSYGKVARVMAGIRQAGITNLGLVTAPETVAPPKKSRK
ncbi:MAG: protein TolR [Thermodesulfatator sp.]|nr:MAG: protein TolR [Thermodesulfatator sp.]